MQQRHEAGRLISPSAGPRDIVTVTPEMLQCQGGVTAGRLEEGGVRPMANISKHLLMKADKI